MGSEPPSPVRARALSPFLSHTPTHTLFPFQISTALATFGLSEATHHVLVARFVSGGEEETEAQVLAAMGPGASPLPLEALPSLADPAAQAKAYGVGPGEVGPLADAAATRIGVRECG
jgi:hypothetical protein